MPTAIPLPDLPGVYFGRILGEFEGLPSSNIFTFKMDPAPATGAPDIAVAAQLAHTMADGWDTFTASQMNSLYTHQGAEVYPLHTPLSPKQVWTSSVVGGNVGVLAPTATAIMIKHTTLRRGKGSQSRTFISPVGAGDVTADGKSASAGKVTNMNTHFGTFIADVLLAMATSNPGTWSYVQLSKGKLPTPVGQTFAITGSVTEAALSTQRRRTRR